MSAPYRDTLERIRRAFPQPVSDPIHDSYFVHSIMRALDQVDGLKMKLPTLGPVVSGDFAEARNAAIPASVSSVEEVTSDLVGYLRGMTISSHPHTQQNVIAPPTIPSLIAVLLASLHNPNIAWDEYSRLVALAEVEAVGITARMVGYNPGKAGGAFTFGGTGTSLYGVKIGLEKACPGAMRRGVSDEAAVIVSDAGHYCAHNIVGWLGIGTDQLITVPTNAENEIDLDLLAGAAREALAGGRKIAAIIATMGTTDAFGLDDLEGIAALRDSLVEEFQLSYRPHIHADSVIGWAWSVFNDYNFKENPLGFRPRTLRAIAGACRRIRHLPLADSLGVDFHKTGYAPYISSLVLVKERQNLELLMRDAKQMPYLYHFGDHRPGMFTLETSRAGTGPMAALANYRLLGEQGMRVVLGHIVEMTQLLREHLEGHQAITVLNRDNFGTVTLFRVYPPAVDTFAIKRQEFDDPAFRDSLLAHNDYNRKVFDYVHAEAMAGRGIVISSTDCYRHTLYQEPIVALKSFIVSPFVDEDHVHTVVAKVLEAREKVA